MRVAHPATRTFCLTNNAQATITGIGDYEGFQRTYTYAIVKRDMTEHYLEIDNVQYAAEPVIPASEIRHATAYTPGRITRTTVAEHNVNVGEGFARSICTGNYYGAPVGNFQIELGSSSLTMPGYYMGQVDGTLDEQSLISEAIILPGAFTGYVDTDLVNVAYYELYKLEGENPVLVTTYESGAHFSVATGFSYDFSSVYHDAKDEGFDIYILSYIWQDENGGLYSGSMILYVISQVPEASTMQLNVFADDGYFRQEYLHVSSEDGALQKATWSVSDSSVATVDRGAVTFLKPGTVTVTATCGKLSAKQTFTMEAIPMDQTVILGWNSRAGIADVVYDHILLKDGIDYTASSTVANGVMTITITGQGLFEGVISRQFDLVTGEPLGDAFPDIPTVAAGDIDSDGSINNADVVLLLWHTLFPEDYPISVNADLTKDGHVNNQDVVLLLWHSLFPEDHPLN